MIKKELSLNIFYKISENMTQDLANNAWYTHVNHKYYLVDDYFSIVESFTANHGLGCYQNMLSFFKYEKARHHQAINFFDSFFVDKVHLPDFNLKVWFDPKIAEKRYEKVHLFNEEALDALITAQVHLKEIMEYRMNTLGFARGHFIKYSLENDDNYRVYIQYAEPEYAEAVFYEIPTFGEILFDFTMEFIKFTICNS
jgi:hypothetical protein